MTYAEDKPRLRGFLGYWFQGTISTLKHLRWSWRDTPAPLQLSTPFFVRPFVVRARRIFLDGPAYIGEVFSALCQYGSRTDQRDDTATGTGHGHHKKDGDQERRKEHTPTAFRSKALCSWSAHCAGTWPCPLYCILIVVSFVRGSFVSALFTCALQLQ